jgi:hypothetical protein
MSAFVTRESVASSPKETTRKPDFFIIGAPKAGTTSLFTYLAEHPQIFMPRIKEPFYFCSDLPGYREQETFIVNMSAYLNLFAAASDRHLTCGEASPFYLMSKVAVPSIIKFNPEARFIVMLRNPVDLVQSFHSQLVYSMKESVQDFEQAWRLQSLRAQGRRIPKQCLEPALLQYRQVGMLGAQMARLFAHVSPSRVKVLLLDDLATDPQETYEDILAFLGVPSDRRAEFSKINANKVHRIPFLAELVRRPPFPLNVLREQYRRHVGVGSWPSLVFSLLNGKRLTRKPLSPALRLELEAEFRADVRLLECLIDRDLSHWTPSARPVPQGGRQVA